MSKAHEHPRKVLGMGLSALLPAKPQPPVAVTMPPVPAEPPTFLPVEVIDPNPYQPRSVFHAERLNELAQSIRANGIIQPLVVRSYAGRFQIVAGERRYRAACLAGLREVPVVVRNFEDQRLLEITLIENVQREDLNPIELAHAYQRLATELDLRHEEIAERTGKDRTSITNTIRLLKLPLPVQRLLSDRKLSMGHARALLGLPTPELQQSVAEKAGAQSLSVRQVEQLVQRMTATREPRKVEDVQDPNVKAAIQHLERALGTRVRILAKGEDRGRIEIDYYSQEDLERIYQVIVGDREG